MFIQQNYFENELSIQLPYGSNPFLEGESR